MNWRAQMTQIGQAREVCGINYCVCTVERGGGGRRPKDSLSWCLGVGENRWKSIVGLRALVFWPTCWDGHTISSQTNTSSFIFSPRCQYSRRNAENEGLARWENWRTGHIIILRSLCPQRAAVCSRRSSVSNCLCYQFVRRTLVLCSFHGKLSRRRRGWTESRQSGDLHYCVSLPAVWESARQSLWQQTKQYLFNLANISQVNWRRPRWPAAVSPTVREGLGSKLSAYVLCSSCVTELISTSGWLDHKSLVTQLFLLFPKWCLTVQKLKQYIDKSNNKKIVIVMWFLCVYIYIYIVYIHKNNMIIIYIYVLFDLIPRFVILCQCRSSKVWHTQAGAHLSVSWCWHKSSEMHRNHCLSTISFDRTSLRLLGLRRKKQQSQNHTKRAKVRLFWAKYKEEKNI